MLINKSFKNIIITVGTITKTKLQSHTRERKEKENKKIIHTCISLQYGPLRHSNLAYLAVAGCPDADRNQIKNNHRQKVKSKEFDDIQLTR